MQSASSKCLPTSSNMYLRIEQKEKRLLELSPGSKPSFPSRVDSGSITPFPIPQAQTVMCILRVVSRGDSHG